MGNFTEQYITYVRIKNVSVTDLNFHYNKLRKKDIKPSVSQRKE